MTLTPYQEEEIMSKPSRRPNREEIKQLRKDRKKAQKALRERQNSQGLGNSPQINCPVRGLMIRSHLGSDFER